MSVRAVHLVTRLNAGGIARYLEHAREAVDVLVRGRVEVGEREARWTGQQEVLPSLHRSIDPPADLRTLVTLRERLRALRPGVLHTHASKAGALGRLTALALRIPTVHTFHGHVLEDYFGSVGSRVVREIERFLSRGARLTATGPATAAQLRSLLGAEVELLPPGIELPAPSPGARDRWRESLGRPERVALAVGRPAAVKAHDRFVLAARRAGYLPVVAGADRVQGAVALGHVDRMEDLYAAADVVVSASRREGTPFALLEAAWAGRPVVATPVGDVEWVVGDGGIVTNDFEEALLRLHDPNLRRKLGERGAAEVRKRFPAAAVAPRLRELYERVVGGY